MGKNQINSYPWRCSIKVGVKNKQESSGAFVKWVEGSIRQSTPEVIYGRTRQIALEIYVNLLYSRGFFKQDEEIIQRTAPKLTESEAVLASGGSQFSFVATLDDTRAGDREGGAFEEVN